MLFKLQVLNHDTDCRTFNDSLFCKLPCPRIILSFYFFLFLKIFKVVSSPFNPLLTSFLCLNICTEIVLLLCFVLSSKRNMFIFNLSFFIKCSLHNTSTIANSSQHALALRVSLAPNVCSRRMGPSRASARSAALYLINPYVLTTRRHT